MNLNDLLAQFQGKRVLVVGDLMLDEYIVGQATRISPEAPVMVVRQTRVFSVPGGAANVAKNVQALGGEATVVGIVGDDPAGSSLREQLEPGAKIIVDRTRPTTRKTRILADASHQVLRVDHESDSPIDGEMESDLAAVVAAQVAEVDVVLLSDYTKGVITESLAQKIIGESRRHGKPVVANAKPSSLSFFRGATLVSLNAREAAEAAGVDNVGDRALEIASQLKDQRGLDHVLITLGDRGMATESFLIEPLKVEVYDTAGAGDTTIATVALGIASTGFDSVVFRLAAHTSAAVVGHVGVAVPSPTDIERIISQDLR